MIDATHTAAVTAHDAQPATITPTSRRSGQGQPKRLPDAGLACLTVAQVPLGTRPEHHWLQMCQGGRPRPAVVSAGSSRRPPRGPGSAAARWGGGTGFCRSISRQIGMSRASAATVLYLCWNARSGPISPALSTTQNRHICAPSPAELGAAVGVQIGGYLKRSPLRTVTPCDQLVAFGCFLMAACGQIFVATVRSMTDLGEVCRPTLAVQLQPTRARSCRGIARSFLRPQCRAGKIPVHVPLGCRTRAD